MSQIHPSPFPPYMNLARLISGVCAETCIQECMQILTGWFTKLSESNMENKIFTRSWKKVLEEMWKGKSSRD